MLLVQPHDELMSLEILVEHPTSVITYQQIAGGNDESQTNWQRDEFSYVVSGYAKSPLSPCAATRALESSETSSISSTLD